MCGRVHAEFDLSFKGYLLILNEGTRYGFLSAGGEERKRGLYDAFRRHVWIVYC